MSGNSKFIMSLKILQQQRMSSSQLRFCCGWLSLKSASEPVFIKAGLAVNKEVYISKCLPVLHNFIQKHHKNEKIVFLPHLASAYYAKDTLVRLEELKIEYVPKEENPPNVPQIRDLEKKDYSNKYRPKDVKCLMAKIRKELKFIETTRIRKAMKEIPAKARKAHRQGVAFFCK
jgi:hypothetical protein